MSIQDVVDLAEQVDSAEFQDLLRYALFRPTEDGLRRLVDDYRSKPQFVAYGVVRCSRLVAMLGLEMTGEREARIRHIAVALEFRRQGIGSSMIYKVQRHLHLRKLSAETDRDAEGFYRCAGFDVRSLGEKYPGIERYECILRA